MNKRFFSLLLALMMVACLLPTTTAFAATGNAIQLGTDGIEAGDKVYFGTYTSNSVNYDIPWTVLGDTVLTESTASGTNVLPLLSDYILGTSAFRDSTNGNGYYNYSTVNNEISASTLQTRMGTLYNGFDSVEQGAIADTTLRGDSMHSSQSDNLSGQKLFPLSLDEAAWLGNDSWGQSAQIASDRTAPSSAGWWWLRSSLDGNYAFCVDDDGYVDDIPVGDIGGVRPAFNLDLNSVLFTSAAVGGKSVAAVGSDLNQISTSTPSAESGWKLTLEDYDGDNEADGDRDSFAITTTALSATSTTVSYQGAKTGTNEFISAMIVDNGAATYYGRIKNLTATTDASGSVTVNIPTGVTLDSDTVLYIFNEQFNGDRSTSTTDTSTSGFAKTDYASALRAVTEPFIPVTSITMTNATTVQVNTDLTLVGTVAPDTATNQTIEWSVSTNDAGTTGASVSGSTFTANTAGTATVTAKIINGATASTNYTQDFAITVTAASAPTIVLTSGSASFVVGNAPANEVFTIGANITGFNATNNFNSLEMDASTVASGTNTFTVANGSIVLTFAQSYLNTLSVGTHTVKVNLKGTGYAGTSVSYALTVTATPTPPSPTAPTITDPTAAKTVTVTEGSTATLSVTATNATGYQWQINRGSGWENIPGATGASYTTSAVTMNNNGYQYRCIVSNANGSTTSPIFTLNVVEYVDVPATGDNSMPGLWIGIMLLAGMGLAASVVLGGRKRREN